MSDRARIRAKRRFWKAYQLWPLSMNEWERQTFPGRDVSVHEAALELERQTAERRPPELPVQMAAGLTDRRRWRGPRAPRPELRPIPAGRPRLEPEGEVVVLVVNGGRTGEAG